MRLRHRVFTLSIVAILAHATGPEARAAAKHKKPGPGSAAPDRHVAAPAAGAEARRASPHGEPSRSRKAPARNAVKTGVKSAGQTAVKTGGADPPSIGQSTSAGDARVEDTPAAALATDGTAALPVARATKTKVYTFGAMDVEGKLKTPQLLYFLNRIKLELEMSAPDHRSFMKELEKTADDPNL